MVVGVSVSDRVASVRFAGPVENLFARQIDLGGTGEKQASMGPVPTRRFHRPKERARPDRSRALARLPPGAPASALLPALAAKGLFGLLLGLAVAGLTFRGLGDDRFAHEYQSKNLMRQIAASFSTAVAAIAL